MDYRQKYLKYKKKYLNLQKQNGGRDTYDNFTSNTGAYTIQVNISGKKEPSATLLNVSNYRKTYNYSQKATYTTLHRENQPTGIEVFELFETRLTDEKYDLLISKFFFNDDLLKNISKHDRWKNISEIYFLHCKIDDNHCKNIAIALIKITELKILNLNNNRIGNNGATLIANALKQLTTKSLTRLQLSSNKIGDRGANELLLALFDYKINVIDFGSNNIGDAGLIHLTQLLQQSKFLTVLNLHFNNIGNDGAIIISVALQNNSYLTTLNLRNNKIGDNGAIQIGEMLSTNKKLENLHLDHNKIGDKGAKGFFNSIKQNTTLTLLQLDHNKFDILLIIDNIISIKNIEKLYLGPSHIGTSGTQKIIELIKNLPKFKTINLYDSNLNDKRFIIFDERTHKKNIQEIQNSLFTDQELHIDFDINPFPISSYIPPYKGIINRPKYEARRVLYN